MRALVTTPWGVVASQERVEVEGNRITWWMIQFPIGDRRSGDPLGLGFDDGERNCNSLGLGSVVVRVGDGDMVAKMLRSMMVSPSGDVEVVTWLMPASPFTDKGITPSVQS
jgi:hypothetical protein